jgi:hypothetical protein
MKNLPDYPCDFCNAPIDQNQNDGMFRVNLYQVEIRGESQQVAMWHICPQCVKAIVDMKKEDRKE